MCLAVYAASAVTLPLIAWDQSRPAFHAAEVAADDPVRARFSLPNVRYLGSHQKCGCGFKYGVTPSVAEEAEEEASGRASVEALRAYVACAAAGQPVELFACWEGEQALPALGVTPISLALLGGSSFEFQERFLLLLDALAP